MTFVTNYPVFRVSERFFDVACDEKKGGKEIGLTTALNPAAIFICPRSGIRSEA